MAKRFGYSPVSIFAAGCGAVATIAATANPIISVPAATAASIGAAASAIAGGIELNDEEKNIKENLDEAMDKAWNTIDQKYRLSLHTEKNTDNCLLELKREVMGENTSVDEFVRNISDKGLETSISIVIQSILKRHQLALNKDPEIIWGDEYLENAAEDMASILVAAIKSVFEDDDQLRILKAIADSTDTIVTELHQATGQVIDEIRTLKPVPVETPFSLTNIPPAINLIGREKDIHAMEDYYPQRCSNCDRINYNVEFNSNTWKCKYCGYINDYQSGSRFESNGELPYVECMCGEKIPIYNVDRAMGSKHCPFCQVRLNIKDTELNVSGDKASEVLQVMKTYMHMINEGDNSKKEYDHQAFNEEVKLYETKNNPLDTTLSRYGIEGLKKHGLIVNIIEKFFRTQFDNPPENEKNVQEQLRKFFDANGYKQGVDYEKESGKFHFSGREYIPDFVFKNINTVLEVKLLKDKARKNIIIEEMNADCNAYLKEYSSIIFLVYDIGCISNVEEFIRDFENKPNITVLVIKH